MWGLRLRTIAIVVAASLSAGCALAPAPAPATRADLALGRTTKQQLFIEVMIGGQGPILAVPDTAAAQTVVDVRLAVQLGLRPLPDDGPSTCVIAHQDLCARLPERQGARFDLGPLSSDVRRVRVDELDLGEHPDDEDHRSVGAILGADVLSRFMVEFDYPSGRLRLYTRNDRPSWIANEEPLQVTLLDGAVPLVPMSVNDLPVLAVFDSATVNAMLRPQAACEFGVPWGPIEEFIGVQGVGGGVLRIRWRTEAQLTLGEETWRDDDIYLTDSNSVYLAEPERTTNLLVGARMLYDRNVVIDYANRHLYVRGAVTPRTT